MPKISVILTAWQRPQLLEEQVDRVLKQTVPPHEIVLWYNQPPKALGFFKRKQLLDFRNAEKVKKIVCDYNFGIIPRFSLAPAMEGDYVCIFDDDTMPGEKWFENCLRFTDSEKTMCGTIGLRFLSDTEPKTETPRMGWDGCNEGIEFVDLVGHSWFFKREWARHFWEIDPLHQTFGEDIHFCAMLQRHGIRVACPPHPKDDMSLWGSVNGKLGKDKVAISSKDRSKEYAEVLRYEVKNGWKLMYA
ncbi:MAG: Glycosyl transferase family 2 [Syntrophus sp. PtaB.Bin138]|nr:MAG: Glycosyl transferase family 2 [Syntrophus sp. PtaB.Bin138]